MISRKVSAKLLRPAKTQELPAVFRSELCKSLTSGSGLRQQMAKWQFSVRRGACAVLSAIMMLGTGAPQAQQNIPEPADPVVRDSCHVSSAYPLDGIAADFADLLPSTKKYLAGVARQALKDGCMLDLTCVSASREREARVEARRPCAAAARALSLGVPRGPLRARCSRARPFES